jgi:hypothetical protein
LRTNTGVPQPRRIRLNDRDDGRTPPVFWAMGVGKETMIRTERENFDRWQMGSTPLKVVW